MDEGPEPDRSLYFNAYDDRNGIAVLMRIGRRPARGEKSMFFFIMGR